MSQLLVDDIVNKDDTGAPGLSKGIVVTGITTSDSAIVVMGLLLMVLVFNYLLVLLPHFVPKLDRG